MAAIVLGGTQPQRCICPDNHRGSRKDACFFHKCRGAGDPHWCIHIELPKSPTEAHRIQGMFVDIVYSMLYPLMCGSTCEAIKCAAPDAECLTTNISLAIASKFLSISDRDSPQQCKEILDGERSQSETRSIFPLLGAEICPLEVQILFQSSKSRGILE